MPHISRNVLCCAEHCLDSYDKYHENPYVRSDYKDEAAPWFVLLFPSNNKQMFKKFSKALSGLAQIPAVSPPTPHVHTASLLAVQYISEDGCVYSGAELAIMC